MTYRRIKKISVLIRGWGDERNQLSGFMQNIEAIETDSSCVLLCIVEMQRRNYHMEEIVHLLHLDV